MSRNRRRWEQPPSSSLELSYNGPATHYDDWRHYAPSNYGNFDYWREEAFSPTTYHPWGGYRRESFHEQQWRGDSLPREPSYPRRRRSGGDWDVPESRTADRSPPYRNTSRHHYSTLAPAPYMPLSTIRARSRSPVGSMAPNSKPTPSSPPQKAVALSKKPSEALKPSTGYLAHSEQPSELLQDPGKSRKLLVLDLNGTLLLRSARSRTTSGPQLRSVQPRPYMQSFRRYLFCADTTAWLDTMVWSSAQPHSVDDMVNKVFGDTKHELKAVWNRKSLGLSEEEYHRKTVATKDLAKSWDLFPSASGPKITGHSAVPSQSPSIHSAFTSLLLDDSPHKAALQPYNHVCIPEYNSAKRQQDLRSFMATEGKPSKKEQRSRQVETATQSIAQSVLNPPDNVALLEQEQYDTTLLAVIGILDAVKLQSNVAGWIRKGGLWVTQERSAKIRTVDVEHCTVFTAEDGNAISNTVVGTGNDASSTSDPAITSEQDHLRTRTWFDDSSVVAYWVARGRKALMELGIQDIHGVTG